VIVVEIVSEKQGQHDHLEVPLGQPVSREQVVAPKSVAVESQVDRLELIPKLAARKATEATVDRHLIRFHERIADEPDPDSVIYASLRSGTIVKPVHIQPHDMGRIDLAGPDCLDTSPPLEPQDRVICHGHLLEMYYKRHKKL